MNNFKIKIISILSCLTISFAFANVTPLHQDDKAKIQKFMQANHVPGIAVYIYKDGKEQEYLYGYSNLKNKAQITNNTLFELGSITKTFTGLVLAKLVADNKLSLNDKISIPSSPDFKNITLLQLATHSSGLPYNITGLPYNCPNTPKYQSVLTNFLQKDHLLFKPQSMFLYSNIGFSLLGKDLANREQQTFQQLVENYVLSPLKMDSTILTVNRVEYKSYANGYAATDKPARTPKEGMLGASWAMKSTISDMQLFLKAMLLLENTPDSLLSTIKIAQTPYIQLNLKSNYLHQIGLGWSIALLDGVTKEELLATPKNTNKAHNPVAITSILNPKYTSNALIEKTGSTDGFRSYIGVIPSQKVGVVILINKFTPSYTEWRQFGRSLVLDSRQTL